VIKTDTPKPKPDESLRPYKRGKKGKFVKTGKAKPKLPKKIRKPGRPRVPKKRTNVVRIPQFNRRTDDGIYKKPVPTQWEEL
jgi:hypothetical protein